MAYQFIKYEKKDRIAYLTINRPEVSNALHPPASTELYDAWMDFKNDPDVWVAIINGVGDKAFCSGNDLKYTANVMGGRSGLGTMWHSKGGFGGLCLVTDIYKPIIAAVHGYALGGGMELALACDIIVASEDAKLGLMEPRRGRGASTGVPRLASQVPLKVAMGMLLTARPFSAQDCLRYGLVNEVVPRDQLMAAANRWAEEILECAPLSVQGAKQTAMESLHAPLDAAIRAAYPLMEIARSSEDNIEGAVAFQEKRKPVWKGR